MMSDPLVKLLEGIRSATIGVIGDFCLDVYWEQDAAASELSVETGLPTRPIRSQRYSLGGAGNIVSNLLAMGVCRVESIGVIGDDPFGREMRRLLDQQGSGHDSLLMQASEWDTLAYLKPIREGKEESRIDFGNFNRLYDDVASSVIDRLESLLPSLDIVIVNEQVSQGIHTHYFQAALNTLIRRHPEKCFIVDSRHKAGNYDHCLRKLNEVEACKLAGMDCEYGDCVSLDDARSAALALGKAWEKPVFVSRGARGVLVSIDRVVSAVPGLHIVNPVDAVGAGDSMLAGIAAALATGASPLEAATFGNFVAGVTVQKLFQTGTASQEEILSIGSDPDYVYEPELADDLRRARILPESEIETVTVLQDRPRLTHAIFDHDGTISTLRQGWEAVMEPLMIKTILGDRYTTADETLHMRVTRRVREFIDKTTGIQTIAQMQGLVKLVREFGGVPLDEFQYKAIYLEALMELVHERLRKLKRHELDVSDFTVKKAPGFLAALHQAGVKLYLASGTDVQDVIAEAETLGYAPLFEGRIYGAVGDVTVEAKRMVLERILKDIGPDNATQLVVFGDGPVEMREARKRGGLSVGVASDEIRRFGLNVSKRSRLIRAGADIIIPDFSQKDRLLNMLGVL